MARHRPDWKRRPDGPAQPWTPDEEAILCDMVRCGLSCDYYKENLPGRRFGEILNRRLSLIERGDVQRARRI